MRSCLAMIVIALLAIATGCNGSGPAVAAGAEPAIRTNVGPIPGASSASIGQKDPYANDPIAAENGRRLFVWYNCYGCHGGHGGGGMGPSLRRKHFIFGHRGAQIYDSIAEGRSRGMPAWGTKIPSGQIWQLVAYIQSLRTPQEPDPPTEPANEQVPNPMHNNRIAIGTQSQH